MPRKRVVVEISPKWWWCTSSLPWRTPFHSAPLKYESNGRPRIGSIAIHITRNPKHVFHVTCSFLCYRNHAAWVGAAQAPMSIPMVVLDIPFYIELSSAVSNYAIPSHRLFVKPLFYWNKVMDQNHGQMMMELMHWKVGGWQAIHIHNP